MEENFKDWLAELLKKRNLTYEQLGILIGVTHGAVGGWVRGKYTPDVPSVLQLAKLANEDPFKLLNMVYGIPLPDGDAERDAEAEQFIRKLKAMPEDVRREVERYMDFMLQRVRREENVPDGVGASKK